MATFTQQEKLEHRLDWEILRDGGIALYSRLGFLEEEIAWFQQQHYDVVSFNCERWTSRGVMHADLQRMLSFPEFYGRNLDALNDILEDLAVPDVGGMALRFDRFDAYAKSAGAQPASREMTEATALLDVLTRASRYFLLTGRRLVTLVQSNDPEIRFERLGCMGARWNRREWLNKNRGLDSADNLTV